VSRPRVGALCGLLAAALFGASTPFAKHLLQTTTPQLLAGLLYLGAALGLSGVSLVRRKASAEARLRRSDVGVLTGIIALGGIAGPLLLLVGLRRVSSVTGSLLLNLEAPFTMLVAVLVFREHLGRAALVAASFIVGGAALLGFAPGELRVDPVGVGCIVLACLCWAVDNNLTQRLSLRDPFAIVRSKALGAGACNSLIALARGDTLPPLRTVLFALAVGSLSYGLSVLLDTYALRLVGAAREAAYFAMAPFFGAITAVAFFRESVRLADAGALVVMAVGTALLSRDRHSHRHAHRALQHDHVHVHDAHHHHAHPPGVSPGEPHSHVHTHEPLVHEHPHVSDSHHRHSHDDDA
jgi:drug/metabolite transporter (DMT)-like permease